MVVKSSVPSTHTQGTYSMSQENTQALRHTLPLVRACVIANGTHYLPLQASAGNEPHLHAARQLAHLIIHFGHEANIVDLPSLFGIEARLV